MKKLLCLLGAIFVPLIAIADDTAWNGPLPMGNGKWLSSRDEQTFTDVDLVRLAPDGHTEINAKSGKTIKFMVNKTSEFSLSNDLIALTGTASTLQSAGSMIVKVDADAQRLFTFDASSDTALTETFGDGGTTAAQVLVVSASTADADDDSIHRVCGGGGYAADGSRGACISLPGEEVAGGGDIAYVAGAGDTHTFSAGSTQTMSIGATGVVTAAAGLVATTGGVTATAGDVVVTSGDLTITAGALNIPAAANLALIAENGANTACDTTCTQGCVAGFDAGTSAFVACSSALADSCLCAAAGS